MRTRFKSGGIARERGSAIVEFAFASAVFFMTLTGVFSFGIAVWRYNAVAHLAQEGARWASVRGSGATGAVASASSADVQSYVQGRAMGINVTVSTTTASNTSPYTCTSTVVNPSTLTTGSRICVQVTNTFAPLTAYMPSGTMTLQSTAQMMMAR